MKEGNVKMDTLSAIKLLLENNNLKATICWLDKNGKYYNDIVINNYTLEMKWELIKEPVDFMTAINSGKKIKGKGFVEYHFPNWYFGTEDALDLENINGNWYIED